MVGMKKTMAVFMYMSKGAVFSGFVIMCVVMGMRIVIMFHVGILIMVVAVAMGGGMVMMIMVVIVVMPMILCTMVTFMIIVMHMCMFIMGMGIPCIPYLPFLSLSDE